MLRKCEAGCRGESRYRLDVGCKRRWLEKRGGISAQGFISLQTLLVYKGPAAKECCR